MMEYPYRLFIMLTSICNLNCMGCGHFCEINQEHGAWFISLEQLEQNLNIIQNKFLHLKHIMLIGGEPMVHPQFLEICKIVRTYFPHLNITIMTNGVNLNTYTDNELKQIVDEYNIEITTSIYPTTIQIIKKQYQRFQNLNLKFNFQGSRINFTKFNLDRRGKFDNIKNFEHCSLRLKPEFTLANTKLYSCCISPRLDLQDIPETYNDYLDIRELKNEAQIYELKMSPPHKCRFCNDNLEIMPWHSQQDILNKYFTTLEQMFVNEYQLYNKITNSLDEIYKATQDSFFMEHLEEVFEIDSLTYILHKFNPNTIDLYIPITNHTNLNYNGTFYQNLVQQSIIKKCNLYIVCLNMNKINEVIVYNTFTPYKNNNELYSYLYKANNLKEGYEKIKNEGYGKITYTLNLEDKKLENPKFLEEELKEYL